MRPSQEAFDRAYQTLNDAQREAVDAIEGPVLVVAGPGTGKTQVLTLRAANILRLTDVEPENILALTFTEHAAANMRKRLMPIIGSAAYRLSVHTFHGFCNDAIRTVPDAFPTIIGSSPITDSDSIRVVRDIFDRGKYEVLKPLGDPFFYVRAVVSAINDLKREAVSEEAFGALATHEATVLQNATDTHHKKGPHAGKVKAAHLTHIKRVAKTAELVALYREYQATLRRQHQYDFNDMIVETLRALQENEELLRSLQERYQYIMVDEHQDTNRAQNAIVERIASFHERPNIFAVGDEKQAIFRFQGASVANFRSFTEQYPGTRTIILTKNYRSDIPVLVAAYTLIPSAHALEATRMVSNKSGVRIVPCESTNAERAWVASDVRRVIDGGVAPHEIAILYRDNRNAFPIARALEREGVPYVIESDDDALADPDVQKLRSLLMAIANGGADEYMVSALHADFLGIGAFDVYKVMAYARKEKILILDVLRRGGGSGPYRVDDAHALSRVAGQLLVWIRRSMHEPLLPFIEAVLRESGFIEKVVQESGAVEKLAAVTAFFNVAKTFVEANRKGTLHDFLQHLDILVEQGVFVRRAHTFTSVHGRVRLMTAHRAKGLEFDAVYIAHATDSVWGNRRIRQRIRLPAAVYGIAEVPEGEEREVDDDRRLFYVALTRARTVATITYAAVSDSGRSELPSVFINEIEPHAIVVPLVSERAELFSVSVTPPKTHSLHSVDAAFIQTLFDERGLSVTALNNYLECPWKYFYTNLLRIPRAKTPHEMYGTAMHRALRDFGASLMSQDMNAEYLTAQFERYLREEPLPEPLFKSTLARGCEVLAGYVRTYGESLERNVLVEFSIAAVFLDDIRLTGAIDTMEFTGNGSEVIVVDYKTGKPKTRGDIEGKTKASRGNIKRQLVFYKTLLDRHAEGKYRMVSGAIQFIEPDERGRYHRESFTVTPEETTELEEIIRRVAGEIRAFAFNGVRCEEKECDFCALQATKSE